MAWRGPTSPMPSEINPRMVFERLFGDGERTAPAARMARLESQRSVLDYVSERLARLATGLGARDRRKLDEYLESVRDVERRVELAERQSATQEIPTLERPASVPDDYSEYARL